jgi:hypothetical protein
VNIANRDQLEIAAKTNGDARALLGGIDAVSSTLGPRVGQHMLNQIAQQRARRGTGRARQQAVERPADE